MVDPPTIVLTGVYFDDPAWNGCGTTVWRVDGTPGAARGLEIRDLLVPAGATEVHLDFRADFENVCTQMYSIIDGVEYYMDSPNQPDPDCGSHYFFHESITPGVGNLFLGTGPNACDSDVTYGGNWYFAGDRQTHYIRFSFIGACDNTPGRVFQGTGTITP
jgi:hypothetical protein